MPQAAMAPIMMGASAGMNVLGGLLGGPKTVSLRPPAPLFPGAQQSYIQALTESGVTPASMQTIADMAKTGAPTDVGPFYEAMKAASQRGISEGRTNLIEQFGVGGLRYGSDILKAGTDYEAQTAKDFASILAGYTQQASEAAANRRLQAATLGQQATGELATAFYPTEAVGGQSGVSQGLQAGGGALQNLMMMKLLFGGGGAAPTTGNIWPGGYNAPFEGPVQMPSLEYAPGSIDIGTPQDPGIYP